MSRIKATAIHDALDRDVAARMDQLEVFDEIDSTNSYLMQQAVPSPGRNRVAIADHQTAGRGRHSREWISAPGSSLCLSIAYSFKGRPANLPGLTLAIGVAARDALHTTGVGGVMLKWPNDLVANDGKLGGMLTETHVRSDASTTVIAGIGINVSLPKQLLNTTASSWSHRATDISGIATTQPTREALSAALVNRLVQSMDLFETAGMGYFVNSWRELDWLRKSGDYRGPGERARQRHGLRYRRRWRAAFAYGRVGDTRYLRLDQHRRVVDMRALCCSTSATRA